MKGVKERATQQTRESEIESLADKFILTWNPKESADSHKVEDKDSAPDDISISAQNET